MTALWQIKYAKGYESGYPWLRNLSMGYRVTDACLACGTRMSVLSGDIVASRDESASPLAWPDIIGCDVFPLLVVSRRFLGAMESAGVAVSVGGEVNVDGNVSVQEYVWLDPVRHKGADLDFEASGIVNAGFCPLCGTRIEDIAATYRLLRSGRCQMTIDERSWTGAHLFTTNLSRGVWFCTRTVKEAVRRSNLDNFRFKRVDSSLRATR